jgi:hypothetical protein
MSETASKPSGLLQESFASRRGLPRTLAAVRAGKLCVAHIGGSITCGYASSEPSLRSARARLSHWLRLRTPSLELLEIDAGVGGTNSIFGAHRLRMDVLDRASPDLLIVEFAVNDDTSRPDDAIRGVEGIVRQALNEPDAPDVCLVYAACQDDLVAVSADVLPPNIDRHERVAAHYDLPSIWMGLPVLRAVIEGSLNWNDYFVDSVHPNDCGFALYSHTLTSAVACMLRSSARPRRRRELPEPVVLPSLDRAGLVDVDPAWTCDRWAIEPRQRAGGWNCFSRLLSCDQPDAPLVIPFSGVSIGTVVEASEDSGTMLWSVDDSPWSAMPVFDEFSAGLTRPRPLGLASNLPPGQHTLRIRVAPDKPEQSRGRWVRIGQLLVDAGPASNSRRKHL